MEWVSDDDHDVDKAGSFSVHVVGAVVVMTVAAENDHELLSSEYPVSPPENK